MPAPLQWLGDVKNTVKILQWLGDVKNTVKMIKANMVATVKISF